MAWEIIEQIFRREGIQNHSKSNVLTTPVWFQIAIATTIVALVSAKAPEWVLAVFVGLFAVGFLAILGVLIFFSGKNPEMLRTEWHSIRKLEIEHGIAGDSTTGIIDAAQMSENAKSIENKPLQIGRKK